MRLKNIPCDVIWMDIDYMQDFKIFTFDSIHFPNPKETNDYLHQKDFKSVWMIDPGVKAEKGFFVYDSGEKINAWVMTRNDSVFLGKVWPGDCVFLILLSLRFLNGGEDCMKTSWLKVSMEFGMT